MLPALKKYLLKNRQPDCLACFLQRLVEPYLATPIQVNCPHLGNGDKDKFSRNSRREYLSKICYAPVFVAYIFILYDYFNTTSTVREFCRALNDINVCINTFVGMICIMVKLPLYLTHTAGLSKIIDNRRLYFIDTLIPEDYLRSIVSSTTIFNVIFIAGTFIYSGIKLATLVDFTYWELIKIVSFNFCLICMQFHGLQRIVIINLTSNIFHKFYRQIMSELTSTPSINLCEKLKMFQRFYIAMLDNVQIENTLHFEYFIVSWLLLIIMAIGDLFVVIIDILEKDYFWDGDITFFRIHLLATVIGISGSLFRVEKLATDGNGVISFLYRYPISRLSREEAVQLEGLIIALTIGKPRLGASNIFTLGTRLLTSVSSTTVTYTLAALQFYLEL